jgi:hypothetical protein
VGAYSEKGELEICIQNLAGESEGIKLLEYLGVNVRKIS